MDWHDEVVHRPPCPGRARSVLDMMRSGFGMMVNFWRLKQGGETLRCRNTAAAFVHVSFTSEKHHTFTQPGVLV